MRVGALKYVAQASLQWINLWKICTCPLLFYACMFVLVVHRLHIFLNFGPQTSTILFPTDPLWSDISEEMTSLRLSRGAWWEKEQRPVYERRVSHGEDIRVSHPVWHYSGWKSGAPLVILLPITRGQRKKTGKKRGTIKLMKLDIRITRMI